MQKEQKRRFTFFFFFFWQLPATSIQGINEFIRKQTFDAVLNKYGTYLLLTQGHFQELYNGFK